MRRTQLITTAALVAACAVPTTAAAQTQDLRSPDTRDAAIAAARLHEYMYSSDPASAQARAQGQTPQDLRSPDARDAGSASESPRYTDLRSPDARDAGSVSESPRYTDLRSPDARDVGLTHDTGVAQDLRSPDARDAGRPQVPPADNVVEIREVPTGGFDWGDAGIGAAGILALLSIGAGLTLLITGRRRRGGSEKPAQ